MFIRRQRLWLCAATSLMLIAGCTVQNVREAQSKVPHPLQFAREPVAASDVPPLVFAAAERAKWNFGQTKADGEGPFESMVLQLDRNFSQYHHCVSIAWASYFFLVHSSIRSSYGGFLKPAHQSVANAHIPFDNFLFVTTPFPADHRRSIVIIAGVSPEETSIFSVGPSLRVRLLFDSLYDTRQIAKNVAAMGSIYEVRVVRPGNFLLYERHMLGAGGRRIPVFPERVRVFEVTFPNGHFNIRVLMTSSP